METEKILTTYISVDEALEHILSLCTALPSQHIPLTEAYGRVLAQDVVADCALPHFSNSAMDGFAVRYKDVSNIPDTASVQLRVIGESVAGSGFTGELAPGTAVRIMTGAPVPAGADTVVPFEDTSTDGGDVVNIHTLPRAIGQNVRQVGEDVAYGECVLAAGNMLRPQDIAMLASLGNAQIHVVRRPNVAIITTGDELTPIDAPLQPGHVRNSNAPMLAALVESYGGNIVYSSTASDNSHDVARCIRRALMQKADLIMTTAGVSVGDHDVVRDVLDSIGDVLFWKVRMKPGKPLVLAQVAGVPVIGLPGNPVSAFTTAEVLVRPALYRMAGKTILETPGIRAILYADVKGSERKHYLPVHIYATDEGYHVAPRRTDRKTGAHAVSNLVWANALLPIPEGSPGYRAGDVVLVYPFRCRENL